MADDLLALWRDGQRRLDRTLPPRGWHPDKWQAIRIAARRFIIDGTAERAVRCDWGSLDIFAGHPTRIDLCGLIACTAGNGLTVAGVSRHEIELRSRDGALSAYRRRGAVALAADRTSEGRMTDGFAIPPLIDLFAIPAHPVAALFPMMTDAELDDLAADIKATGQQFPITLSAEGEELIDGRNRREACRRAGVEPKFEFLLPGEDATRFIVSANLKRRHLDADGKRKVIAELLKIDPARSDRAIAKETGASPSTVGTARKELEQAGEVSKLDTRTDAKGHQRPAAQPPRPLSVRELRERQFADAPSVVGQFKVASSAPAAREQGSFVGAFTAGPGSPAPTPAAPVPPPTAPAAPPAFVEPTRATVEQLVAAADEMTDDQVCELTGRNLVLHMPVLLLGSPEIPAKVALDFIRALDVTVEQIALARDRAG
jgi:ParB-like chromosome segregation protein Spo0J